MEKEKVLRKVSVKDRLPDIESEYHCVTDTGELTSGTFYKQTWLTPYRILNIEYWYEEVSVKELFHEYDKELAEALSNSAKERYKKALSFVLQSRDMMRMPRQILNEEMYKALRMAAGLKEDKV